MLVSFVKGVPALFVRKERVLVVGDLHVGLELKFKEKGIHFQKATEKLAESILATCDKVGAKGIVLLGDVKESITYPKFAELMELKKFFSMMKGVDVRIAKGNHDGNLEKVLKDLGFGIGVEREILLKDVSMLHGNAWPSQEAMQRKYLVCAHGHFAIDVRGKTEKAWVIAKAGLQIRTRYKSYNKNITLVLTPPFNELILGTRISDETEDYAHFFRQQVFDWKSAKVYGLDKKQYKLNL